MSVVRATSCYRESETLWAHTDRSSANIHRHSDISVSHPEYHRKCFLVTLASHPRALLYAQWHRAPHTQWLKSSLNDASKVHDGQNIHSLTSPPLCRCMDKLCSIDPLRRHHRLRACAPVRVLSLSIQLPVSTSRFSQARYRIERGRALNHPRCRHLIGAIAR